MGREVDRSGRSDEVPGQSNKLPKVGPSFTTMTSCITRVYTLLQSHKENFPMSMKLLKVEIAVPDRSSAKISEK